MELKYKVDNDGNKIITGYENMDSVVKLSEEDNIIAIDRKAFLSCKNLKKIYFPTTIEKIDDWAFSKCSNLKTIKFKGNFKPGIFGKGVFDGCDSIEKIAFANFDDDTSVLLALATNRLKNEQLLRSFDIGEKSWFNKWDMTLVSYLATDDKEASTDSIVCGEEDTSYTGMVDGEMPTDGESFIISIGKNKCLLCFERLLHNKYLEDKTRIILESFIKERSYESKSKIAWFTLKEETHEEIEYYKLYLDIVKPEKDIINEMILNLNVNQVQAKAFLIGEAANHDNEDSFFDDLLL